MNKTTLIVAAIALLLAFGPSRSQAQSTNVSQPTPDQTAPVPPPPQKFPPRPRPNQPRPIIMRTMNDLRMVKAQLQRSHEDYGGHKDSAIEACDRALQELEAVMKASMPQPPPQQTSQAPAPGAPAPQPLRIAPPSAPPAPAGQPAQPQP
jgi:hypothetical protein